MKYNIETLDKLLQQNGDAGNIQPYHGSRCWLFEKKYTYTERELSKSAIERLVKACSVVDPKREYFWKLLKKTAATEYVTAGGYPTEKFREEVLKNIIHIIHDPSSIEHKSNLVMLGKKLPVYFDYQQPLLFVSLALLQLMVVILPITLIPSAGGVTFPFAIGITIAVVSFTVALLLLTTCYLADRSDCRAYKYGLEDSQQINFGLFKPILSQTEIETNQVPEKNNQLLII